MEQNSNHSHNLLSKLNAMVNNKRQWDAFNNYIDWTIIQQQASLEQNADSVQIHRAQGAIGILRKLKQLRDEVNSVG